METAALAALLGYFFGSIPTAFLLVRWKSRIDIRHSGSGNVGALNSFEVSGSWGIGAAVLLIDLAKGSLAVLAARVIFGHQFRVESIAGLGAVLGHIFSVWLGFRGGRGLATGAGAALPIVWPLIPLWLLGWLGGYALTRSINPASLVSSVVLLAGAVFFPDSLIGLISPGSPLEFRIFAVLLQILFIVTLVKPFAEYLKEK